MGSEMCIRDSLSTNVGDLPLRTPTHRRLGGPLPRQPANAPHGHPPPMNVSPPGHAPLWAYGVLVGISTGYPPVAGRFHTCYSPVRRSPAGKASFAPAAPRLACVRPVASVHPEPGSNSPLLFIYFSFFSVYKRGFGLYPGPGVRLIYLACCLL